MTTLKFKCELLSDVILNQKAATEGPNQTLDFIPGSNFMGIVAAELYGNNDYTSAMNINHSGKVKFGDAHPSVYDEKKQVNYRGLKVPSSMFYPKLSKPSEELYIHHYTDHDNDKIRGKQLKQCRAGFYDFSTTEAKKIETETNFAIKSAHDKQQRRSKDEAMYGYESLQKGLTLFFEVECEESHKETIVNALTGTRRIGRSRTAQYGLVKIEEFDYKDIPSNTTKGDLIEVYADGRLIFLDENGMPTFQPTPKQLGIEGGEIIWEKSQIRTFQYSPWNYKRQCFDTDRCGIEKGSVFVIKNGKCEAESKYVGSYQNEGFGKVIYNPEFLSADSNGMAKCKFEKKQKEKSLTPKEIEERTKKEIKNLEEGKGLLAYLGKQKKREFEDAEIFKMVSEFVNNNQKGGLFTRSGEKFASQWGQIRSIAMSSKSYEELYLRLFGSAKVIVFNKIFGEKIISDKEFIDATKDLKDNEKSSSEKFITLKKKGYLSHGKALEKWETSTRVKVVDNFLKLFEGEDMKHRACEAVVNLAAEMAKEMTRSANKNYKEGK